MRTAIWFWFLLDAPPAAGGPTGRSNGTAALRRRDGEGGRAAVEIAVPAGGRDDRVDRGEEGLDVGGVAGPLVGRRLGLGERFDQRPDGLEVQEGQARVLGPDTAQQGL